MPSYLIMTADAGTKRMLFDLSTKSILRLAISRGNGPATPSSAMLSQPCTVFVAERSICGPSSPSSGELPDDEPALLE